MVCLLGKTGSGKTEIQKHLIVVGYHPIIQYTTRPIRKNEIPDKTYHYISEEDFKAKIDNGFFVEWEKYHVVDDVWYYGTSLEDIVNADDYSVIILPPDGYRSIMMFGYEPLSFLVSASNDVIMKRLNERGDNLKEIERRLKRDSFDFSGIENEVDCIVENNKDDDINEAVKIIDDFVKDSMSGKEGNFEVNTVHN